MVKMGSHSQQAYLYNPGITSIPAVRPTHTTANGLPDHVLEVERPITDELEVGRPAHRSSVVTSSQTPSKPYRVGIVGEGLISDDRVTASPSSHTQLCYTSQPPSPETEA